MDFGSTTKDWRSNGFDDHPQKSIRLYPYPVRNYIGCWMAWTLQRLRHIKR
jgi:hypothetical protein